MKVPLIPASASPDFGQSSFGEKKGLFKNTKYLFSKIS